MRLENVYQNNLSNGRTRLSAEVSYDTIINSKNKDRFYFEYPSHVASCLVDNGNPWITLFLPISVILKENLSITRPVDPLLLEGCQELLRIWNFWNPNFPVVEVNADVQETSANNPMGKTGTFFSGGIDSMHTLVRHELEASGNRRENIDELISIIDLYENDKDTASSTNEFRENMRGRVSDISNFYNKRIIDIRTNVWSTRFSLTDSLTHSLNSLLMATVLSLGDRYSRILIPSSWTYKQGLIGTSHPLLDRLHSTTTTKVIPDAYEYNRFEKILFLSNHEYDFSNTHVCSRDKNLENCSECYKCLHTMLGLEVLDKLKNCHLFKTNQLDSDAIALIYCSSSYLLLELDSIRKHAEVDRLDIVHLVDVIFRRSAWIDACRRLLNKIRRTKPLNSVDIEIANEITGKSKGGEFSIQTRISIDSYLNNNLFLYNFLNSLSVKSSKSDKKIAVSASIDLSAFERVILSSSIVEPTLERQIKNTRIELSKPEVIYIYGEPLALI